MSIISIIKGNGFSKEMYDKLRKEVAWETDPIDGWIIHTVYFDESGEIHMQNIWESTEKLERGFETRLMPIMKRIGMRIFHEILN